MCAIRMAAFPLPEVERLSRLFERVDPPSSRFASCLHTFARLWLASYPHVVVTERHRICSCRSPGLRRAFRDDLAEAPPGHGCRQLRPRISRPLTLTFLPSLLPPCAPLSA
jgi:hypothetical protein